MLEQCRVLPTVPKTTDHRKPECENENQCKLKETLKERKNLRTENERKIKEEREKLTKVVFQNLLKQIIPSQNYFALRILNKGVHILHLRERPVEFVFCQINCNSSHSCCSLSSAQHQLLVFQVCTRSMIYGKPINVKPLISDGYSRCSGTRPTQAKELA